MHGSDFGNVVQSPTHQASPNAEYTGLRGDTIPGDGCGDSDVTRFGGGYAFSVL
jgi:hypothetical protein